MSVVALYLLIGVMISMIGGAWRPTSVTRPMSVKLTQIIYLITMWLPSMVWLLLQKERA